MIKAVLWLGMLTTCFAANAGVVIENVTIVDVINGQLNPAQNVLISADKMVAIQSNTVPGKHQRIDGSSQYLLPGLWDMHTHLANKPATRRLRLFIANGVTGVREMFSDCNPCNPYQLNLEQMNGLRRDINTHKRLGPRLLALSAPIVDLQGKTAINNFVKQAKKRGADFIKTYTNLPRQSYLYLVEAAKAQGLPVAGHVPNEVPIGEALSLGHQSVEHARTLPLYCVDSPTKAIKRSWHNSVNALTQYNEKHCQVLLKQMADSNTYYVPTHLTRKMDAFAHDPNFRNDPRLQYIDKLTNVGWQRDADNYARDLAGRKHYSAFYQHGLKITGMASRAGVNIMLGTDANDSYVIPGFSVHDELQQLVDAGLTPLEALQAATIVPARFMGLQHTFGSVEKGKMADLVLLAKNPLDNIRHSQTITAVIYQGKVYNRRALDDMLLKTAQMAK